MNICRYIATRRKNYNFGFYDLILNISPEDAINEGDAGETTIIMIDRKRCEEECAAMVSMGYTLKSDLRAMLGVEQNS